jgi:hypothetical protein
MLEHPLPAPERLFSCHAFTKSNGCLGQPNYSQPDPFSPHCLIWAAFAGWQADRLHSLRCYGLGSPTRSLNSRYQAALIPIILGLIAPKATVEIFDPIFDDSDCEVLQALGCVVLEEEYAMQHCLDSDAANGMFFYMPHCDADLYNSVLDAHWSADSLERLAVLGNSFAHMTVGTSTYFPYRSPAKCRTRCGGNVYIYIYIYIYA